MIPRSYEQWRQCITVECGLELTPQYIAKRLETLQNEGLEETQIFIKRYGEDHWRSVQSWFRRVQLEI